jgi:L-threonylcarbamoyladenylate synthase
VGLESTVLLLAAGDAVLLRPGGLPVESIEDAIGPVDRLAADDPAGIALSPGRQASHYAPGAPLVVVDPWPGPALVAAAGERLGLLAADLAGRATAAAAGGPFAAVEVLSTRADPTEAAANLFDALHRLDAAGVDRIVVQPVAEDGLGHAIMDRLRRAARR